MVVTVTNEVEGEITYRLEDDKHVNIDYRTLRDTPSNHTLSFDRREESLRFIFRAVGSRLEVGWRIKEVT